MNPPKIDVNGMVAEDVERKRAKAKERTEITFKEYLKLLEGDPLIAQNAQARHYENVLAAGMEEIPENEQWLGAERRYPLFSKTLYGIDHAIEAFVDMLKTGKDHTALGKQVVLLVGPPGTGKSTTVSILAEALENSARPVYAIKGCSKHEEPLHLLPRHLRKNAERDLGVRIEGDLCPHCRARLKKDFTDSDGVVRWQDVPVVPFSFSKRDVRGITVFEPSSEKAEDVTKLTGREITGVTQMPERGYEDPYAYDLSGAIPKSERGLCEGRELLSSDPDVLGVFFSVAQERELKITNSPFPHISVDTLVIGHTNLTPFKGFEGNKVFEGLHKRFHVILWPYALRIKDELALYRKLIERESDHAALKECHIAPGALELAATFAVMTRLVKSQKDIGLLTKAKVYNGEVLLTELEDKNTRPRDLAELLEEGQLPGDIAKKEGMFGVDPRDVMAALNMAMVHEAHGSRCLTPLSVIKALRDVFKEHHRIGFSPEEISSFLLLLSASEDESVMTECREWMVKRVSRAFLNSYKDLAQEIFDKYIREISYWSRVNSKFVHGGAREVERDKATGKPREPDTAFMRSVEQHIPWTENEAKQGRGELLAHKGADPSFSFDTHRPLRQAVEQKLLKENKGVLTIVLSQDRMRGEEDKKRVSDLFASLKENEGCCEVCAQEFVEQARKFLDE